MSLRDVPEPVPGEGEVLIEVHAAGLNPVDLKTRDGLFRGFLRYRLPIVAGNELAGVVRAVGTGVTHFAPGDRVYTRVDHRRLGAFAELAAVQEEFVARMPASLGFAEAAALPLAGLAALQVLRDHLSVRPGDRILITGGAGGVGTLAIQLAVALGAEVVTTASPEGAGLVRGLGVGTVIDYRSRRIAGLPRDYDGVLDTVGGRDLRDSFTVLRPGSLAVSLVGVPEPHMVQEDVGLGAFFGFGAWFLSLRIRRLARRHGVRYRGFLMHPSGADLDVLSGYVETGALKPVIETVYPFGRIGEAFARLESGRTKGKLVVEL
ncbi:MULTISPECIES: NADP-dependent oxidoreductase [Arthrobacter]|uniref:NADP-dependent oxidoreductase n=2 Tax=Arthrobacter TaxID=1663 RepID=A0ABU9KKI6_9MICC|nr:NADP-dependent oxidoreductase [Arthrobacter sp. YJM1]MDP5227306.1 NADP-dependent oxidoreductase [Arthrobacter sp. YJM1]